MLQSARWVTSGNYKSLRDLLWPAADTLIWLDYALPVVMSRLIARTLRRVITGEPSVTGNRETIRNSFLSRDSVIWWAGRNSQRLKGEVPDFLAQPEYQHLAVLQFVLPRETDAWFHRL